MGSDSTFYGMFVVGCMNWVIGLFWTGANLRQEWSVVDPNQKPELSIIAPGKYWLLGMGLVMMAATVITMMTPEPDIFWQDPYKHDWILIVQSHAIAFFADGLAMFGIMIAVTRLAGAQKHTVPRVILAGTLCLIQLSIEAPTNMPYTNQNHKGWDHNSLALDFCYHQIGLLTYALVATLLVEIFVANRAVVYVRIALQNSIALFWTFMAFAFLDWCDGMDQYKHLGCDDLEPEELARRWEHGNPFSHDYYEEICGKCSLMAQGVQIYQARMVMVAIASIIALLTLLLWAKCVPSCIISCVAGQRAAQFARVNQDQGADADADDYHDEQAVDVSMVAMGSGDRGAGL